MKIIFSSVSRLFFSYSKFFLMVVMISATSTAAISSDVTYLECNDKYYKLTGTYIQTHYNIRSKKFTGDRSEIYQYGVNYINTRIGRINRNTGEFKTHKGKLVCILKEINFNKLPKLNQAGKLF